MCSSHNTHSIETPKNPNFGYPTHHYTLFWKHKAAHRVIILVFLYLLHIQEWKSNRFPKIITVFTSHFEMFVPFFFNQWVVLNGHGVPHKIFLRKNNQKNLKMWDLCNYYTDKLLILYIITAIPMARCFWYAHLPYIRNFSMQDLLKWYFSCQKRSY